MKKISLGVVSGAALLALTGCLDADLSFEASGNPFAKPDPVFETVSLKRTAANTFTHTFTSDRAGTVVYGGEYTGLDFVEYKCVPASNTVKKGKNVVTLTVAGEYYQSCNFKVASAEGDTNAISVAYVKLDSNGKKLPEQDLSWVKVASGGNELDSNQWSCIKDIVTSKVWEVKAEAGDPRASTTLNWNNAMNYASSMSLCGKSSGWRAPTIAELQTLLRAEPTNLNPADEPYYNTQVMPNSADAGLHWSSEDDDGNPNKAKVLCMKSCGLEDSSLKATSAASVRLIHD